MPQKCHAVDQILPSYAKPTLNSVRARRCPKFASCQSSLPGATEQTYYRWRKKYRGMKPAMAQQLKALEKENARLKKMIAEQAVDKKILKEAAKENG